jgi:HNH endonuclease/AP2 domain
VYNEHQLAWFYMTGRWPKPTIDHRDGDSTNNRWNNLRQATASQNNANRRRPRNNTSGYKGVYRGRRPGQWRAQIGKNGRTKYLGTFPTRQAAHAAYVAAARKHYGEFARAE